MKSATAREHYQDIPTPEEPRIDMLSMMAHEMRTPLSVIIGFAQLLRSGNLGVLDERQARYLRHIEDSGRHLHHLTGDLLDLSKLEAGRLDLSLVCCPLPLLTAQTVAMLQPLAANKEICLTQEEGEDDRLTVMADALRVRQVLFNLIANAIKFTSRLGRVSIGMARLGDGFVRISVRDSGHGIASCDLEKLFKPYSQLQNADDKREGSGLGLALSKKLVELMGGRIGVVSTVGVGSQFFVDLRIGQ